MCKEIILVSKLELCLQETSQTQVDFNGFVVIAVNKAFQFSSITSVTIILTWFFLGTKYSLWQFFGAALCVSGLFLVLLSDSGVGGGGGSNPVLGDALVIAGTCFFALSNVGEVGFHYLRGILCEKGFMFNSLTPLVLQASGATLFNLSLLTADMWTVVIRVEKHSNELPKPETDDPDQPYQLLAEEAVRV
ncbi:hypothetical protein L1987_45892 [Smallanthus sonchifolius]|uniref:Uncharacterized protein n=1 Tax=Smallanthus sonchifolius TaxID=185202 RepID=A0ACB9FY01_9ASTR|nr:hypothetical protein L1987_45892 [Smallanthus sonchifolius]